MHQRVAVEAIYALRSWCIREHRGKYQISPTVHFRATEREWSRPYASLTRATNAIARKLQEEWVQRHQRKIAFYGKKRRLK